MVNEQRLTHQQQQQQIDDTAAPKTPSVIWGPDICYQLCLMCGVQLKVDLPELWPAIAAAGIRDHLTIETIVNTVAQDSCQQEHAPIITPELAKRLVSLRLSGDNVEDLADSLQPFALTIQDYSTQGSEDDA
jgi:hypothetical protein